MALRKVLVCLSTQFFTCSAFSLQFLVPQIEKSKIRWLYWFSLNLCAPGRWSSRQHYDILSTLWPPPTCLYKIKSKFYIWGKICAFCPSEYSLYSITVTSSSVSSQQILWFNIVFHHNKNPLCICCLHLLSIYLFI